MTRAWLLARLTGSLLVVLCASCSSQPLARDVFVPEQRSRDVLEPVALAWLSSEQDTLALPSAVPLGTATAGRTLLYLEFAIPAEARRPLRADLLLTALGDRAGTVDARISRATEPRRRLERWSDQPRVSYPIVSVRLSRVQAPDAAMRIDVRELLTALPKNESRLRVLVAAEPQDGEGLLIATGTITGAPPRLDLYW